MRGSHLSPNFGQVGPGTLQAQVARPLPLLCPTATSRTYGCEGGQWHNPPERADDLEADAGAVVILSAIHDRGFMSFSDMMFTISDEKVLLSCGLFIKQVHEGVCSSAPCRTWTCMCIVLLQANVVSISHPYFMPISRRPSYTIHVLNAI